MKFNEIYDPEKQKKALDNAMAQLRHQYAPAKQMSPEEIEARRQKRDQAVANRKRVESVLEPIAVQAKDFEEFSRAASEAVPEDQLRRIDLSSVFARHNPVAKQRLIDQNKSFWDSYGAARAQGNDPTIHGVGPTGQRNYTGD